MKKNLLIMIVLACVSSWACSDGHDDLVRTHTFKVIGPTGSEEPSTIDLSGKKQKYDFKITATVKWSVKVEGAEGFSLSDNNGIVGRSTISLFATMNDSGASRTATLTFYLENGEEHQYEILQTQVEPFIDVVPSFVSLSGDESEFTLTVATDQKDWTCEIDEGEGQWISEISREENTITLYVKKNNRNYMRRADIRFYSTANPEIFTYLTVQQSYLAEAPTADLLDVVFNADGSAHDISSMGMSVDLRADNTVRTSYVEKYDRYAGVFTKENSPLSSQATGYYVVPYSNNTEFKSKLESGFTIEMLVRRYDEPNGKQIKPFASTQAGGAGICFRAHASNEFNFEVHTGGAWRNVYSGITPKKNVYYHAVATWNKETSEAKLYVDGVLTGTNMSAIGDFKFMTSNVNALWFGIGADPNHLDLGEATFHGEVVIARLYSNALTNEEVDSLWKLVQ